MRRHPKVYIIAGSNGSGKTTFAMEYLPKHVGQVDFINADLIARGLSPLDADNMDFKASRIFLERIKEVAKSGKDFAFETTLSGKTYVPLLKKMKGMGYFISMFYLWIPNSALALQRIKGRVLEGGHDVPDAIVRRRFKKTLWNLFHVYDQLLDQLMIFDNSSEEPRALFEQAGHRNQIFDQELYSRILNEVKQYEKED
ncbi:MAG: hypothetical protein A3A86_03950 [Elusimicrobia bacterium RIFCSPLOWO2_01_FULL_60_11]|nr:MAG: hypothetical protein A3A86_03950 [Elusimicrobia bacterium RIFCSPLOWO2_01_FULL_60_11]